MRILVDECLPRQLKTWLEDANRGLVASTVVEQGWAAFKNGKLLRAASEGRFNVLVTADKNMYYQQSFAGLALSGLVIPSNRKLLVQKSVQAILKSIAILQPGQKVVMDLGPDSAVWHTLEIAAVHDEVQQVTHKFAPPVSSG